MFYAIQNGGKLDYNLKTYYAKDEADLNNINTNTCCPGSQAYTANGKLYTLNSNKEWIEVKNKEIPSSGEEIIITPAAVEQIKTGLFNKVTVAGDSNLVPENIKEGTKIFGVIGTMQGTWDTSQIRQCYRMFSNNTDMTEAPNLDLSNSTDASYMFYYCKNMSGDIRYNLEKCTAIPYMFHSCLSVKSIELLNTNLVKDMGMAFYQCGIVTLASLNADKVTKISQSMDYCTHLKNFGGFINLGKNYSQKTTNYSNYSLTFSGTNNLTHESLINIINNLYDLNLTYNVENGGTLYTQKLTLGNTNLAKLTAE